MKPTRNKVFCKDCDRTKMLFETKKKADNFIKFNKEEIEADSGYAPERSYFCVFCGGWHTTSLKEEFGKSKKEKLLENYLTEKAKKAVPGAPKTDKKEKLDKIVAGLENQISEMSTSEMEMFFTDQTNLLKKEIDALINSTDTNDKAHLKELRQYFEIVCTMRKQKGFAKKDDFSEKIREKENEDWKSWFDNKGYDNK
jgi:vacuolar-type H+-ATPase subunit I/STV1